MDCVSLLRGLCPPQAVLDAGMQELYTVSNLKIGFGLFTCAARTSPSSSVKCLCHRLEFHGRQRSSSACNGLLTNVIWLEGATVNVSILHGAWLGSGTFSCGLQYCLRDNKVKSISRKGWSAGAYGRCWHNSFPRSTHTTGTCWWPPWSSMPSAHWFSICSSGAWRGMRSCSQYRSLTL